MSEIYIHYGNLEDSVKQSQKVRGEIADYVSEIKKRITTPISSLSGSDSAGYASTASSLAWQKINSLNTKATRFETYEKAVNGLVATAKAKDNHVSTKIDSLASMYIEERTWYQKAGDWIYNTFCVDLANKWDWTRDFTDAAKWVGDKIGNGVEKIADWFKYGDGKYVWNIVTSVVASIAAIAGTIAAIVAIPFSGGATIPIVIGCIGATATAIGSVITIVNSASKIKGNAKALSLSGDLLDSDDGNPGAARYYGNISTLSSEWEKTDMGGQKANDFYEGFGKAIDTTKVVADTTAFVCNIASLGNVKDYRFKNPNDHVKGYSFTWDNIKKNLRAEMGLNVTKGGFKTKTPFSPVKSFFAKNYNKSFMLNDTMVISEGTFKVFKGVKIFKNVADTWENLSTLDNNLSKSDWTATEVGETVESITGLGKFSKFTSIYDKFGTKGGKTISSWIEDGAKWYELLAN